MLILSRKPQESIIAFTDQGEIEFKVLSISGNQVKIGVAAPKEIKIHREEVYERILNGE